MTIKIFLSSIPLPVLRSSGVDDLRIFHISSTMSEKWDWLLEVSPKSTRALYGRTPSVCGSLQESWRFPVVRALEKTDLGQAAKYSAALDAPYWEALREGRLVMQCCQTCETWHWPAKSRCAECGTWDPQWRETPMEGLAHSWAKTWYPFKGAEGLKTPFVTALVALPAAGGRRLMGLFEGDESVLALEAPLKGRLDWTDCGGRNVPCIRWRPA
jgi:uncharacterized OB-fold protein